MILALSAGFWSLSGLSYSSQTPISGGSDEGIAARNTDSQGILMKERSGRGGGGGRGGRGG